MEQQNPSGAFDVWTLAKTLQKKQTQSTISQRTLIIVGQRNSGKTSFVKVLKSQNQAQSKPTCAIDYTFVRKAGVKKQIINCYEIATKNLREVIKKSLLNKQILDGVNFVINVDLGEPGDVIDSIIMWTQIIREESEEFLEKQGAQFATQFKRKQTDRLLQHQDFNSINPLPIPTTIVLNKYDLFEKYETEIRKWISRTIRYLAHLNGCSVFTNSIKSSSLSAQVRSIFHSFISNATSYNQRDHMKPVFITFGNDSFSSMSLPHTGSMRMEQALKKQLQGLVGIKEKRGNEQFDFSKYRENRIDELIKQKEKEFEVNVKKNKMKNDSFVGSPSGKRKFI